MDNILENSSLLLVDNSKTVRNIVRTTLEKSLGAKNIAEYASAYKAWEAIESDTISPNWIISGWETEGMSGFDLLEKVKKKNKLKNVPFIIMTSHNDSSSILKALDAGVTDYLVKPFSKVRLLEDFHRIISSRYLRKTPRYKDRYESEVALLLDDEKVATGNLMDLSSTDLMIRVIDGKRGFIRIYDKIKLEVSTLVGVFKVWAMLVKMERNPNPEDFASIYALLNIQYLEQADSKTMDRFIELLLKFD